MLDRAVRSGLLVFGLVWVCGCGSDDSSGGSAGSASGGSGGSGASGASGGSGGTSVECSATVDTGVLSERVPANGWPDLEWEDPYAGAWTTIDVSTKGVLPGKGDVAPALQAVIDGLSGPTILELPAGTYELHATVKMRGDLILRGAGPRETVFSMVGGLTGAFSWTGEGGQYSWGFIDAEYQPRSITAAVESGAVAVPLASTAGLAPGDLVLVAESLDKPSFPAAKLAKGGIFELTSVAADGVTLDLPLTVGLRMKNDAGEPTVLAKVKPMRHGGIESVGFTFPTLTSYDDAVLELYLTDNVYVRNVFSTSSFGADVRISNSRRVLVSECFFDRTQGASPDGGESIWIDQLATRVLVTNNIVREKHPALVAQVGGNFVVYAYNFHVDRLADYCHATGDPNCRELEWIRDPAKNGIARGWHGVSDVVFHGNFPHHYLIEGNNFYNAVFDYHHFENGPGTTLLRNRIQGNPHNLTWWMNGYATWIDGPHDGQNLVGGVLLHDSLITTSLHNGPAEAKDLFVAANGIKGTLEWGALGAGAAVPKSLYRGCPPPFWGDALAWPPFGPELPASATNELPAELRYQELTANE